MVVILSHVHKALTAKVAAFPGSVGTNLEIIEAATLGRMRRSLPWDGIFWPKSISRSDRWAV